MYTIAASNLVEWVVGTGLFVTLCFLIFAAWWALFQDRPGDRRRCPRCWYDITHSPGMTCAECGYASRRDKDFRRTRRRRSLALLSIFGCTMIGLYGVDHANTRGWMSFVPTRCLVWLLPVVDDTRGLVLSQLDRRIRDGEITDEQWLLLLGRSARGDGGTRPPSDEWSDKYGRLTAIARARAASSPDAAWRAKVDAILLGIPPLIDLSTRDRWPAGIGPTVDVRARAWWPASTRWRIRCAPQLPGAEPDVHRLRDAPIQPRSYSLLLPALEEGSYAIEIVVTAERRTDPDESWTVVEERTIKIRIEVEGSLADSLTPVSGDDYDEVIRQTFGAGLTQYLRGSLPVRIAVRNDRTFIPLFDHTAVAARVEILRNGRVARRLDIWWAAGTDGERQHAWEVPMLDDELLAAPAHPNDEWVVRAVGAPELALRVDGVSRYWAGAVSIPVNVRLEPRQAPPRGWITDDG